MNWRRRSVVLGLLAALIAFVYWDTAGHTFLDYDDVAYVVQNPMVSRGITGQGIVWAFSRTYQGNWHPLTWLSHMTDVSLFGMAPGPPHVENVLLHVVNSALLLLVLVRLTGLFWDSACVAVLFAIHPLHVESVAWVAERKDVLSAAFSLAAILAYVHYVARRGRGRYLLVVVLFALGLLAKPMTVTLPFVLLLFDFWPLNRVHDASVAGGGRKGGRGRIVAGLFLEKAPLFLLTALSGAVTYAAQAGAGALLPVFFMTRAANAVVSYAAYLGKTLWPARLAVFYPYPEAGISSGKTLGAFLLLAGITALACREVTRRPWLLTGWLYYGGTLVPVIGLVQVGSQSMADRYTYLPIVGLLLIAVWWLRERVSRWHAGAAALAAAWVATVFAFSAASRAQVERWRDNEALFAHALRVTTDNWQAHNILGLTLARSGRLGDAVDHLREAVRIQPGFVAGHVNLGDAYFRAGRLDLARASFAKALELDPRHPDAHFNLGVVLDTLGDVTGAAGQYQQVLSIDPAYPDARPALSRVLHILGRHDEARAVERGSP